MVKQLFFALIVLATLAVGCDDTRKAQRGKPTDYYAKYEKAKKYYNDSNFVKAQMLFEELNTALRSTDKGDSVAYYNCYCNFYLGDYYMASYLFRNYFRTFPTSPRASECLYMSAYCHYLVSPAYSLDQADTYSAIEEFQYFIQMFPGDTAHIRECNKLVDDLHRKLEKKTFTNAKMYYEIQDYKAAIAAFDLFLHDYPETHYREEVTYYTIDSKYKLAENSVDALKEQRVNTTIDACNLFLATYAESEFTDEIKSILDRALKLQDKLEKDKKTKNANQ
jgi:outer membrane protein assembly factor BamD